MATLNSPFRKTHGQLDGGYKSLVRVLDFNLDLATDVTMGTATDVINLGTLPFGAQVISAAIQQVQVGTGTGTLTLRSGTTALTGALTSTDPVDTFAANLPAATPRTVPLATEELNLLGATAVRNDGKIRVIVAIVEGDRTPIRPGLAGRDTSTNLA